MRKEKLHTASMIIGSMLALLIAFSQFLMPECGDSTEKVKTEQSGKTAGEEEPIYISLPTYSLPVPINVQVNLDAYCLFEILFEEDIDEDYVEEHVSYTDRFFETMFQVIISPNAP